MRKLQDSAEITIYPCPILRYKPSMFDYLASPTRFGKIMAIAAPVAWCVCAIAGASGIHAALIASPADYQQGESVRIMYIHVPAAWMALSGYLAMAVSAFFFLVWKHPLADIAARAMTLPGAGCALLTLITGALWGKPIWGAWWVWDARLTSMLILFFLYIGYAALVDAFDRRERGSKAGAILLLVGVINLPVIKFSVDWWNTLHQGASIFRAGGPTIHASMLTPLFLMAAAMLAWFIGITMMRMRAMLLERATERRRYGGGDV